MTSTITKTRMTSRRHCRATVFALIAVRGARLVAPLAVCLATQGCTCIGAGFGSSIPRYERVSEPSRLRMGEPLRLRVSGKAPSRSSQGALLHEPFVHGDYLGLQNDTLHLADERRVTGVPLGTVKDIERKNGTYWWAGALVGLAIDIVAVAVVIPNMIESSFEWDCEASDDCAF